jgi:SAM-dependent methyltransferase
MRLRPNWQDFRPEFTAIAEKARTLHIGAGKDRIGQAMRLDLNESTQPDVVHDLTVFPWPLEDASFDAVLAFSVLEHLPDFFDVLGEIHRILKPGCAVYILVPHFSSASAKTDPTHIRFLGGRSCDYFISGTEIERDFGFYVDFRFRLDARIIDLAGWLGWVPGIERAISRNPDIWERHWCYMVRGAGIFWKLTRA